MAKKKVAGKTAKKPVAKKAGAKKPAAKAAAPRKAATYTPRPVEGIGWAPFRYPLPLI